jgi:deoxyribose-phosphate aldolase
MLILSEMLKQAILKRFHKKRMTPMNTARHVAERILLLIDLTTLSGSETDLDIIQLCKSAMTDYGNTAAICVYPKHVTTVKTFFASVGNSQIKLATVVNFPTGEESIEKVIADTRLAIEHGANEIDLVLPYQALMAGDIQSVEAMLSACKHACADQAALKVIIESGVLCTPELIVQASELCLKHGADFIKTSTGKVKVNATQEAAQLILQTIKDSGRLDAGLKVSGGVKTLDEAKQYLSIAQQIMGDDWINPAHFRFGASSLLNHIIDAIEQTAQHSSSQ